MDDQEFRDDAEIDPDVIDALDEVEEGEEDDTLLDPEHKKKDLIDGDTESLDDLEEEELDEEEESYDDNDYE